MWVCPGRQLWWLLWEFSGARHFWSFRFYYVSLAPTSNNFWLFWSIRYPVASLCLLVYNWDRSCGSWGFVPSHFGVCEYKLPWSVVISLQNGLNISSVPCTFILLLTSKGRDYISFWIWGDSVTDLTEDCGESNILGSSWTLATMWKGQPQGEAI